MDLLPLLELAKKKITMTRYNACYLFYPFSIIHQVTIWRMGNDASAQPDTYKRATHSFMAITFSPASQYYPIHITSMTTRVALVTGGAQGIGKAIALRLAHDGFDIAVDDLPGKVDELKLVMNEIQGIGRKVIMLTEDVTQEDKVKEMVERTVKELGRLDVVC
jgi:hypothetical protein